MDLMRYILALGVVIDHYDILAGHSLWYVFTSYDCVGAFFALSGFLVYPSFEKKASLKKYLGGRARRILPPYFFIVLACAVGLAFVSSLTVGEYFASPGFWKYLASNILFLNWMQPDLPGVFDGAEFYMAAVNGSLWTMKVEWCLYFSVPIVVWFIRRYGLNRKKTVLAIIICSILYRWGLMALYESTGREVLEILSRQFFGQLAYFYCGVLIYFMKDEFERNLYKMMALGLVLYMLVALFPSINLFISPVGISVLVMSISLFKHTPGILRHRHNVSYEIYLFHFPLIQLLVLSGLNRLPVAASFSILITATIALAVLCHFAICLPFLKKRN